MRRIRGLIAATHTPFAADGSLRLEPIDAIAERLATEGLAGAFVGGTTGEFFSLSMAERRALVECWGKAIPAGLGLVVHVGGVGLDDARDLARHAARAGAHGIAAVAPYFVKPETAEELAAYCAAIASAAPDLAFYYYHIPCLSNVRLSMRAFLEAAAPRIPNLAGLKYSDLDIYDLGRCVDFDGGRFDMLFGFDEALLGGLAVGCRGAVGTTYNFSAPLSRRLIEAFGRGDHETAQAAQSVSRESIAIFQRWGGHAAMKAVMGMTGIDCGPARPPLRRLGDADLAALRAALDAIGFFAHCASSGAARGKVAP